MTKKVTVRTTGDFMFADLRTGEHALPGKDNLMTHSALVEGAIDDGRLKLVKEEPEAELEPVKEPAKAAAKSK